MKKENKNIIVNLECVNTLGMPVSYKKKVAESELAELKENKEVHILSIKYCA